MLLTVTKQVPVAGEYDVVVCGGGPSGWVAAVAAARMGRKTALIERNSFLGGAATASLVVPISGFYKNGERVVGGVAWELVQELLRQDAALIEFPKGHVSVNPEYYKLAAQRMALEAGVSLYCGSVLSGAIVEDGAITAVTLENRSGTQALTGRYFIDATGDGELCARAGIPTYEEPQPQPPTLCFALTGVDVSTPLLRDSIHHTGKNGTASCQGEIRACLNALYQAGEAPAFGGPWFNTLLCGDLLAVNITRGAAPASDAAAFAQAERAMREDMFRLVELLRQRYPEFKNCAIAYSAMQTGVREGRHLRGAHRLAGEELLSAVPFPDAIARAAHPVDLHKAVGTEQQLIYAPEAGYIPYRSLIAPGWHNFLAAGRLVCADAQAHASLRVQATAMAIGQAAGTAAALCCEDSQAVQALNTDLLRDTLRSAGCVF